MKMLLYAVPVLIIAVVATLFLFNTQIKISEELPLEIIIFSTIIIISLGLITLMVRALKND
jgi:FtsH-binding integral membrane protein